MKLAEEALRTNIDDSYCNAIYYLTKELHQDIDGEYSVGKFLILLEELEKDGERQEKESKKYKSLRGKTF